jgi:transcription elongation factor Elf1
MKWGGAARGPAPHTQSGVHTRATAPTSALRVCSGQICRMILDMDADVEVGAGMGPLACQLCGRTAEAEVDARLSWVMERDGARTSWTCPSCALENVRAMEAKLDAQWW